MQKGGGAPGSKFRIPQMVSDTLGFGQKHDATVDIPLDTMNVMIIILCPFLLGFFLLWRSNVLFGSCRIRRRRRESLLPGKLNLIGKKRWFVWHPWFCVCVRLFDTTYTYSCPLLDYIYEYILVVVHLLIFFVQVDFVFFDSILHSNFRR